MPKFYFARHQWRTVTEYYEVEAEDDESAWDLFMDGEADEIGFNVGGRVPYTEPQEEYIGTNGPETDYIKTSETRP